MLLSVHNKPSDLFIAFHFVASAFIVNVLYGAFSTSEKRLKRKTLDPLTWLPKGRIVVPQRCCGGAAPAGQPGAARSEATRKSLLLSSLFEVVKVIPIFIYTHMN